MNRRNLFTSLLALPFFGFLAPGKHRADTVEAIGFVDVTADFAGAAPTKIVWKQRDRGPGAEIWGQQYRHDYYAAYLGDMVVAYVGRVVPSKYFREPFGWFIDIVEPPGWAETREAAFETLERHFRLIAIGARDQRSYREISIEREAKDIISTMRFDEESARGQGHPLGGTS